MSFSIWSERRNKLKGIMSLSTMNIIHVDSQIKALLMINKKKSRFYLILFKSFSHNLILKNEIFILLIFHKKMIVQYKLNCLFTRKLHRNCMERDKNMPFSL